jgi:hypothetical protein
VTIRALIVWSAIVPIAIVNGALRDLIISPYVGAILAHVISTALLCLAIVAWTWLMIPWIRPPHSIAAVRIGLGWLALTVAFEFLAGHFVFGTSWSRLIADYNVAQGRVWILVLATTVLAPWLAWRGRRIGHAAAASAERPSRGPEPVATASGQE